MKKIAIIEEIDKEGLKLLDNNPKFTYEIITEKVESEVKNFTNKRNSFLDEDGQPKELSRIDSSRLKSYNSYLKAYAQISSSIDTKLGSRANCENLIPLYQRDFETFKNDGLWLQRAMNRMYAKGCNDDPLFVTIVEQKNNLEPNADTSFYLGLLKEKAKDPHLCFQPLLFPKYFQKLFHLHFCL